MHVFIMGNSGSGKTSLAKRIAAQEGRAHVDLDPFAWTEDRARRDPVDAVAEIWQMADGRPVVIEGCYADLVRAMIRPEDRLIWLDVPVDVCVARCQSRPFEPHKWASPAEQDAFLPDLIAFVRTYPVREDDLGRAAHLKLFMNHTGQKTRQGVIGDD
ncbi:MAG: shikimate kinase [Myxococcota bacterium]